jgi:hypothetical protein
LINYPSPWLAFLIISIVAGYPKIPFTGIPIALVAIIFDWKNILRVHQTYLGKIHIFICIIFFLFCFLRLILGDHLYLERNLLFCLILCYKGFIGFYLAFVFIYLLNHKKGLIFLFIAVQLFLMLASAFNELIYSCLLLFQTAEVKVVFDEIFGLRSLGFGLIHNEGVVTLILMYVLFVEYSGASGFVNNILGILGYLATFSSRLLLVFLPTWQILKNKKLFFSVMITLAILVQYLDVTQGPLSQAFEFYTYFNETGTIGSQSTNVISDMAFIPSNLETWMIGDGQFFSENGFYQNTDIGFSRIIFFGGSAGLFLYLTFCCWPMYFILKRINSLNFTLILFLIYVFGVSNIKGVNIQTWSFIALYILTKRDKFKIKHNFLLN